MRGYERKSAARRPPRAAAAASTQAKPKASPRQTYGVRVLRPATEAVRTPLAPGSRRGTIPPEGATAPPPPGGGPRPRERGVLAGRGTAPAGRAGGPPPP